MKKTLFTLVVIVFVLSGCSIYIEESVSGVVLNVTNDKRVYTTITMVGKTMIPKTRTSRSCYYDVEVEGNVARIKVSGTCKFDAGDQIELKKLYDKKTDKFVGYDF